MPHTFPESKDHGANMGPTWVLSAPGRPHVGPMNLAIRVINTDIYRSLDDLLTTVAVLWIRGLFRRPVPTVPCIVFRESRGGVLYDGGQFRYVWYNGLPVQRWPKQWVKASGNRDKCLLVRPNHSSKLSFINCTEERSFVCRKELKAMTGKE